MTNKLSEEEVKNIIKLNMISIDVSAFFKEYFLKINSSIASYLPSCVTIDSVYERCNFKVYGNKSVDISGAYIDSNWCVSECFCTIHAGLDTNMVTISGVPIMTFPLSDIIDYPSFVQYHEELKGQDYLIE